MGTPWHLLTDVCDVHSASRSVSADGGTIYTYALRLASQPCLVQPVTARESERDGRVVSGPEYRAFLAPGTAVASDDRIVWSGTTLEVKDVTNLARRDVLLECDCVKVL